MNTRLLFVHALSPLHAGTGQSYGAIDLAIARDKATGHPYLPGSSLKGSLRSLAFADADDDAKKGKATALFGPDTKNAADHAGTLAFGDANLLLLPVRSVRGTFAWVTSPLLLARFLRDAKEAGLQNLPTRPPRAPAEGRCHLADGSELKQGNKVYFEDLDFTFSGSVSVVNSWAQLLGDVLFKGDEFWPGHLKKHLCVVNDDTMSFLCQYATDVVTRNVLDPDTKTVANLWDEENLPAETVLYAMTLATPNKGAAGKWGGSMNAKAMFDTLATHLKHPVQLGGKATVGRGRCNLVLAGGAK